MNYFKFTNIMTKLSNNPRKPITVNLKIHKPMENSLNIKYISNKQNMPLSQFKLSFIRWTKL